MPSGSGGETGLAGVDVGFEGGALAGFAEFGEEGVLGFLEEHGLLGEVGEDADEVPAEGGLDDVGDGVLGGGEGGVLEGLDHGAAGEEAEVVVAGAGRVGGGGLLPGGAAGEDVGAEVLEGEGGLGGAFGLVAVDDDVLGVDALGGVTVDVPEDIVAGNGGMSFSEGEQVMSGEQALAYARERYNVTGGDFGRAQAQRQIVEAVVRQVLASDPLEIPGLVAQLADAITTDLSLADIVSYALELQGAEGGLTLYSAVTPSYALEQDGVSDVATMYGEGREMMRRADAGLDPATTVGTVPLEQRQNERLGAATNAAGPRDYAELAAAAHLTTRDTAE